VSIDYEPARGKYRVRWREEGRQRSRRFATRQEAETSEISLAPSVEPPPPEPSRPSGDGVYAYTTTAGRRWRCVFRQSDGSLTTRRGFESRSAAVAARSAAIEAIRRGEVRVTRATFGEFWAQLLETKRPYVTAGTLQDYATQGRKRLLPWFGDMAITAIDEKRVRDWLDEMLELVAHGELSPKTVNNARTCLSMTLGEAVRHRHLPANPCRYVPELPVERTENYYLRLDEIDSYLDAGADRYRALAEILIGTGARISEALAVRWPDVDLETGVVRISRQRARGADGTTPTKGKRFRSVQIGPRLVSTLQRVREERCSAGMDDGGWLFLCPLRVAAAIQPGPSPRRRAA
jgi:integrase